MRRFISSIIVLWTASLSLSASAQSAAEQRLDEEPVADEARSDAHYREAVRMMNAGRYLDAAQEFSTAIDLAPAPILYCNRGIAYIKLAEWQSALADLRICRDDYDTDADEMAQIDAQYRGLRAMAQAVRPRAIEVARDLAADSVRPPLIAPAPVESPGLSLDSELVGHLATGTGAVLLTAALTLDFLSADVRDEFVDASRGATSRAAYLNLRDELRTRQRVFIGLGVAGSALTLTGVSLLAYNWFFKDSPTVARQLRPTLHLSPAGAAAMSLRVDF